MIDFEKCVELAQQRLKDVITAANKADSEEMLSLMKSSMLNELPIKAKWKDNNTRLVIDKYEFTIEAFIQSDNITTDRYCFFGPMPDRDLPDDDFEFVQDILLGKTNVLHWQFGPYSRKKLHCLEDIAHKYLEHECLMMSNG